MKPLLLTFNLLCGADAATTHYGLTHGAREIVLSQNPWVDDAAVAGGAITATYGLLWFDAHEHPKLARVLAWTAIGIRAAAVANNVYQIRKLQ